MHFILKFSFPTTDETNGWVRDGTIGQKTQSTLEALQPEAAYFGTVDGTRGGYWVITIDEASEIVSKVEPFFQELGASVELIPVMTPEELGAGIQQISG